MSADASIDTPLNTDNPWADAVTASDSPAPSSAPDTAAGSGDPWADSSAAPDTSAAGSSDPWSAGGSADSGATDWLSAITPALAAE